ncbi:SRPBCC domain-containing protein [Lentzea sp. NPDC051213]|uniref:SRPBCC domain-containing protein n=1 Tax=Lentzea sp. NPDC051213 TaxID=3364126 RepID=UPI0037B8728D
MDEVTADDVDIEVEVPGSQSRVWATLTTKAELTSWLAEDARVGAGVGDPFELFWDVANPDINSTIGCRIVEWEEPRRFTIEWKGPVQFASIMNGDPVPTWVAIDLRAAGDNTTIVHLRHGGWGATPEWGEARAWHEAVWRGALDQLRTLLLNAR